MTPRILLIDDMQEVRMPLRMHLERAGYRVIEAANGREAMARLAQEDVELIITDIWMPEMDGLDFIRRAREVMPQAPILVITGGAPNAPGASDAARALSLGAAGLLAKPVLRKELLDAVAAAIGPA